MLNKKSFYKLFGLLSIFTITTPIITTAVSCSYDWLGAGGPSGEQTDGNSRVIENNPEISIKQGKEYLDYEGRFGYEYGSDKKWYEIDVNGSWTDGYVYLTPDSFFETYADRIDEFKWFEDDGEPVDYKITIDIEQPFYVSDGRSNIYKPFSRDNRYFKSKQPTLMEFILAKKPHSVGFKLSDFDIIPIGLMRNDPLAKLSPFFRYSDDFFYRNSNYEGDSFYDIFGYEVDSPYDIYGVDAFYLPLSNQIAFLSYSSRYYDNENYDDDDEYYIKDTGFLVLRFDKNKGFYLVMDEYSETESEKFVDGINNINSLFQENVNSNLVKFTRKLRNQILRESENHYKTMPSYVPYITNLVGKFSIKKM